MSETYASIKDIPSASKEMSFTAEAVAAEMQSHVTNVVALSPGDTRKEAINYAAKLLRLPFSRVKCLFYGEAKRIEALEADQIRAYVQQAETLIHARQDYEQRRKDFLANAPRFMARLAPPSLENKA